ncbi:type I-C CRISPR-associated protein Cas8c/Csd1 [Saccharopolyspora cebuensis]|uniref:Type I-C CRISPR-associated protein Cas8c/Csd1 n=1 Tax=Saccharopolyspora cebuensis TaxID=418759 RepID=A0ABV4CRP8_9PSEU
MLLQRLVGYAEDNVTTPPFHREREFVWRLDLSTEGRPAQLTSIRQPDGKRRGQRVQAPAATRTVGVAPQLGADDLQYVFGWGDETTKSERVAACHEQFVALISRWADSAPGDESAQRLRRFYEDCEHHQIQRPEGSTAKEGVLIAVNGELVIGRPSLVRFWTEEVARRKGGKNSGFGTCLVCGRAGALVDSMPSTVAKRLVPGAGNDVALVSVNESVFGYGLTTGLAHTPICFTCGNAVGTGLTHLLSSPHAMKLAGQDSVMTWWVLGEVEDDIFRTGPLEADPDQVNRLLKRLWSGDLKRAAERAASWAAGDRFCSVTLGGNASRIMVRDWIDMPLPVVAHTIARWYDHMRVVTHRQDEPVAFGLWNLVLATGRWEPNRDGSGGRYVEIGSQKGRRRDHVQRDLLARALRGVPLPPSVLHHVVHRIASDGRIDAPRAALLRLALCDPREEEPRVSPGLDENNHDTAYLYGRVFAHLESIQYKAHGYELNTTFGDRFLTGAIGNPTSAVLAGRKLATSWLSKIRRDPTKRGAERRLRETLDDLVHKIDSSSPITGYLPVQRQAQFVLGYHHQRAEDARQRREYEGRRPDGDEPDARDDA